MSLQGTITKFDLFGAIGSENARGLLTLETEIQIDLSPVMLKGAAGRGTLSIATRASANFILASNDQTLASHE